eukprot:GFUD01018091.1.p2 GENE.GFUD01018091.1~~GFUD01018091.1.p2  ORF type:complete len:172 (+),score=51.87 GFUD01018091.1:54-569(+)
MSPGLLLVVVTLVLSISLVESRPSYSYHYQTPGGGHVRVSHEQAGVRKTEGTPSPDSVKANEAALDGYRLGWATGDTDIIIGVVTDTFNFTWVPEDDVVSKDRFPSFFGDFKANAEADGRAKYFMRFANIIHRQIGDTLYEAADWIVDGFDRGSYFNAARDGKVIWDMATT